MRWPKQKFNVGEKRVKTTFLFLPKTINSETRWLESASFREELCVVVDYGSLDGHFFYWKPLEWI